MRTNKTLATFDPAITIRPGIVGVLLQSPAIMCVCVCEDFLMHNMYVFCVYV